MMITGYKGTFLKKDGTERSMFFAYKEHLTEGMLDEIFDGDQPDFSTQRKLPEGMELVYDIEAFDWRIFNKSTQIGELEPYEIEMPSR